MLPEVLGELSWVKIPGVQGRRTAVSHPLANTIGAATLDEQTADDTIEEVIGSFAAENKTFGWRVGPFSKPQDLGHRLLDHGFIHSVSLDGLTISNWRLPPALRDHVSIRQASPVDRPQLEALMIETYPIPVPWAETMTKVFLPDTQPGAAKISTFLAFSDGLSEPVGFAAMFAIADRPIVFLGGASVREEYRRKGIYSSLVAHRLAVAKEHGSHTAVIQAVEASAEACKKLGFRKFCGIDFYVWKPRTKTCVQ